VALLEEVGEFGDRGPSAAGESGHAQEELVLERRDAGRARGPLTEAEELAQLVAELGQLTDGRGGGSGGGGHGPNDNITA
jgi:hypothetical protein